MCIVVTLSDLCYVSIFCFKQKTAYEMRISDWSSDVCSSDLLMASEKPEDQAVVAKLQVIFPNQDDRGTHVNVSGAGVARHAPNKANAIRFLEYLASPDAQRFFTDGNDEFPVVAGVAWGPVIADCPAARKGVWEGKRGSVGVDLGGRRNR